MKQRTCYDCEAATSLLCSNADVCNFFPKAKPSCSKCWTPCSRSWQPVNCCTSSPWSRHRAHTPCPTPWWSPAEPSQPQGSCKEERGTFVQLSHAWTGQEQGEGTSPWAEHSPAWPGLQIPALGCPWNWAGTKLCFIWPTWIYSSGKLGRDWTSGTGLVLNRPTQIYSSGYAGAGHSLQPLGPHSKAKAARVIPGFVVPHPTSDKLNDKLTHEWVPAVQVLRALCFSRHYSPYLTLLQSSYCSAEFCICNYRDALGICSSLSWQQSDFTLKVTFKCMKKLQSNLLARLWGKGGAEKFTLLPFCVSKQLVQCPTEFSSSISLNAAAKTQS